MADIIANEPRVPSYITRSVVLPDGQTTADFTIPNQGSDTFSVQVDVAINGDGDLLVAAATPLTATSFRLQATGKASGPVTFVCRVYR